MTNPDFDKDFMQYFNYDIPYSERKTFQKKFRITQKQLINTYPDVFIQKKGIIYVPDKLDEAKNILKQYYIPDLVSQNKLTVKTTRSNRTLAGGIIKEYNINVFYTPHEKESKFNVLLEDEKIKNILDDKSISIPEKVSDIYNYIYIQTIKYKNEEFKPFKDQSIINNWVRRYLRTH